jgi:hypothetical protein
MNGRALKVLITGLILMAVGPLLKITNSFYIGMGIAFIIEGINTIIQVKKVLGSR